MMRRCRSLCAALIAFAGIGAAPAHAANSEEPGRSQFNVHRVAGNVYMIDNGYGGGNIAVLVGSDGLVLVDADEESRHQLVLATLKQLSDKPVRYVIDTHCHGDHTWGNAAFQRDGAAVVAHRNVRKRLATQSFCGPRPGTGLPTLTFDSELTLYVDDEEVQIVKLTAGHTDGDVVVYFKVIPGHGAQASIGDIRHSMQTLEGMRDAVLRPIRAGKTLDEIRAMNVLSPWKEALGKPCIPHMPCDHADAEYYLTELYTALTTPQP